MKLIEPLSSPVAMSGNLAPRLDILNGKRIGLWANLKLNSVELLQHVEEELRARHEIAGVVTGTYHAGRELKPHEWGVIDTCDAVILANGD
jgi:hypothetical protein